MRLLTGVLMAQDAPEFYRAEPGVSLPRLKYDVKPQYTSDAMRRQVQGAVSLECIVDTNGMPTKIRVVKSLDADLDQEAVKAVEQWRVGAGKEKRGAGGGGGPAPTNFSPPRRHPAPAPPRPPG